MGSLEEQSAEGNDVVELVEKHIVNLLEINVRGVQAKLVDLNEAYHWSSSSGVCGAGPSLSQNACLKRGKFNEHKQVGHHRLAVLGRYSKIGGT